jgi:4-hydroxy-3-methylbut-2-en-1-yl diphosphate synthase IspG/GcpE
MKTKVICPCCGKRKNVDLKGLLKKFKERLKKGEVFK